jgi:DNA cross-link repair 1C protein
MRIYRSLLTKGSEDKYGAQVHHSPEAPGLVGFICGNTPHAGCLTLDDSVRLHSCEKGTFCSVIVDSPDVVWIQPIIAHLPDGRDMVELGIGGGGEDLEREAELDLCSPEEIVAFLDM